LDLKLKTIDLLNVNGNSLLNSKREECVVLQKETVLERTAKQKYSNVDSKEKIITSTNEKGCHFKKLSITHSRKYCCSKVRTCSGNKCKYTKKNCSYKGPVISRTPKKTCFKRRYANSLSTRQFCCKWEDYCYGKSCRPIGRKCNWTGKITQRFVKSSCKWAAKVKLNTMQVRCCNWVRTCKTSSLNKEENCTNSKKRCKFVGKVLNTKTTKKCGFKAIGNSSKRLECCEFKKDL